MIRRDSNRSKHSGFTLVELLIVIVVITILAAISIVAYNGIQQRAGIARATTIVNSYEKLLKLYHVDHGQFPSVPADTCLGKATDFPAQDQFGSGECLHRTSGTDDSISTDLVTALQSYGSLPDSSLPAVNYSSTEIWRGIRYNRDSFSGNASLEWLVVADNDQPCGPGIAYPSGGYTYCYLTIAGN